MTKLALAAAIVAALAAPAQAGDEMRFRGTVSFSRPVVACEDSRSAHGLVHLANIQQLIYNRDLLDHLTAQNCEALPAEREWGVYKINTIHSESDPKLICVVSMFIRQEPTSCLWVEYQDAWIASWIPARKEEK
jgi:hypothetical protein